MEKVKAIAGRVIGHRAGRKHVQPVCNYADNYYGDRVCVIPASRR